MKKKTKFLKVPKSMLNVDLGYMDKKSNMPELEMVEDWKPKNKKEIEK